jgi:hypothetical protein
MQSPQYWVRTDRFRGLPKARRRGYHPRVARFALSRQVLKNLYSTHHPIADELVGGEDLNWAVMMMV